MKRDMIRMVGSILLAGAAILVVLPACGGSTGANTLSTATPQTTATATPAPTSVPTATPTPAPAPTQSAEPPSTPAPTSTSDGGSDDLLAKGKLIFDKTAGGVGCAVCHGLDGKGKSAPYNRGASESRFREVLTSSTMMNFIKLTDEEIKAVVAYLAYLATQP